MSPPREEFTVKEYAEREQVHEQTVRRWIVKGAVTVRKTPGGGVRIVSDAPRPASRAHDDPRR
jgi:excisionase family DNA binding protein